MAADPAVLQQLRAVPLFAQLSERALKQLAAAVAPVEHEQGKELAVEGRDGVGFHLITAGTVEVLVGGTAVRTLTAGDSFGEISLIDGKARSATVRCTTPVTTLALSAWNFRPLLDREPEVAKGLLLALCDRLRSAEARATA